MLFIILLGLIAAAAEILGGALIVMKKEWPRKIQEYLLALSAGFILALVIFELIPESLELLGEIASLYIIIGYGLLHFFEHTLVGHFHFGEETHHDVMVSPVASMSAFAGLTFHAFFDGLSISAGMEFDFSIGILIFIAVLLHKFPEGLTIASIMLSARHTRKNALIATITTSVATLLGVFTVFFLVSVSEQFVGIAFALSAGAATYVGATDLVPEINHSKNRITPLIVFGGMLLFYVSKQLLEGIIV